MPQPLPRSFLARKRALAPFGRQKMAALACCWLVLLLGTPRAGVAHGDQPLETSGLMTGPLPNALLDHAAPSVPDALWWVATTPGALVSSDGGRTFQWLCEAALLGPTADEPAMAVTPGGLLLAGNENSGLLKSDDAGCTFLPSGPFVPPLTFSGLAVHPQDGNVWYVTANKLADHHGTVWQTRDAGNSYTRLPFAAPGVWLTGIALTGNSLVVVGSNNRAEQSAQAYASQDGGQHWRGGAVPLAPAMTGTVRAFALPKGKAALAALDVRRNASSVLLLDAPEQALTANNTHLLTSFNQPIRQVVASADGNKLLLASKRHIEVSLDGGQHFAAIFPSHANACAAFVGERLLTCGLEAAGDPFALAELSWAGAAYTPRSLLRFADVQGPYQCPEGSPVRDRCLPDWPQMAQKLGASAAPPAHLHLQPARVQEAAGRGGAFGCAAARVPASRDRWGGGLALAATLLLAWARRPLRGLRLARASRRRQQPCRQGDRRDPAGRTD